MRKRLMKCGCIIWKENKVYSIQPCGRHEQKGYVWVNFREVENDGKS